MTCLTVSLWGRELELKLYMDCCSDEEVLPSQYAALDALVSSWQSVEDALDAVKAYCIENNGAEIEERPISNIFKYVVPQSLYVPRCESTRTVILLCAYRFDMEHGLGVEFANEALSRIDQQDMLI